MGSRDGVVQDMGVITAKGILGIVEASSAKYAIVQSVLNTNSNINAKIKNTDYFGSLTWDGIEAVGPSFLTRSSAFMRR